MKKILSTIILLWSINSFAQTVGQFRYDTVKFTKPGGNSEFVLLNSTRDSAGILTNIGGGTTMFKVPHVSGDTLFIGNDTLVLASSAGVTSVSAGFGMDFTTITTTGSVDVDSTVIATINRVDSSIIANTPELTDTQVAFGDGSNRITSSSAYKYNVGTGIMTTPKIVLNTTVDGGAATDAAILINRTLNVANSGHGFKDYSSITNDATNYAAFDAQYTMASTGATNHNVGFQSRQIILKSSGLLSNNWAFLDIPEIHSPITTMTGFETQPVMVSGGSVGTRIGLRIREYTGTASLISNTYGVFFDALTKSSNNYGMYDNGDNKFYLQNIIAGSSPTSAASSALTVNSTTKGLLPPRMTAAQRSAIGSPTSGLMVYDSDSSRYMLYNGAWKGLKYTSEGNNVWGLTGNSGTTAGTNFIGTTDAVDLMFKTGGVNSGYISTNNLAYGVQSLISRGSSGANSAFGTQSGAVLSTGSRNAIFGYQAYAVGDGSNGVYSGYHAGNASTGSNNLYLGYNAGAYMTSENNRLILNSIDRVSKLNDTTISIIYGAQDAAAANQRLYLNSKVYMPYLTSAVGTKTVRVDPSTGFISYADTTVILSSRVSTQYDNSTTTLGNVTGLTATVISGKTYRFEAKLYTTSDIAGGVKAAIAGTATATAIIYEGLTTDAGLVTQGRGAALGDAVGSVTAVTAAYITISGTITVNAGGTLTVQFAENAATATSSVLVGSRFTVTEIL